MARHSNDSPTSPAHYKQGGLELITIWKKKLTPEEFQGLCKGNVLKYVIRCNQKGGVEDLKKARQYLDWLIESMEHQEAQEVPENAESR